MLRERRAQERAIWCREVDRDPVLVRGAVVIFDGDLDAGPIALAGLKLREILGEGGRGQRLWRWLYRVLTWRERDRP